MKRLLLTLVTTFTFLLTGYSQQVDWLNTGGGGSQDGGLGIASDENGNNYSVGYVLANSWTAPRFGNDTIVKGSANNSYDGFIVKHDVKGNRKWLLGFGGAGNDAITTVKCIGDTSIVVAGVYSSSIKLDTATLAAPPSSQVNMVVAMLDTAGNVQWTQTAELGTLTIQPTTNNYTPSVDVNSFGEIVVCGSYRTTAKFDTTTITAGGFGFTINAFVASYDASGTFNWVRNVSSPGTAFAPRVTLDNAGNIYTSGNYTNSVTIGSSSVTSAGSRDVYLAKIDTGNTVKWVKTFGGTSFDDANGLAIDKFNNLYMGGRYYTSFKVGDSTLLPNPGTITNTSDAYLVRLDTAGKYIWGRSFGGYDGVWRNQDFCYGVEIDNRGNVGIAGRYGGDKSVFGEDTVTESAGFRAVYVSLIDSTGDFIWTATGTSGQNWANQANAISLDSSKNIYVSGAAQPPFLFGDKIFRTSSGGGFNDIWIGKFADCSEAIKAKIYTGPDTSACLGDSIKLWSNNNPNIEYRWLRNGFGLFLATDSTYKVYVSDDYSVAINDEGCLDTSDIIKVTINKPVKPTLNNFPITCVGDPDFTLTNGVPTGGKYSGIGIKNDTVFSPSTSGIGSFNLNYVYTDTNGCKDSTNKNINVGGQSAFFTLTKTTVCQNEASFILSGGNPTGGTYFGPGVSGGRFTPSSVTAGTYQLGYAYTSLGCSDTAYQNITVNAAPNAVFSSVPKQCASTFSINLSTYGTPGGGSFFGTGVIGSTFYPLIAGAGSFTLSYRAASGSCADTATRVVEVDPVPVATLSAFTDRCANASSFTLTGGAPAGGVYLYNGAVVTSFDPSAVGAGTYTIIYAYSNVCGSDTASQTIKINALPTVTLAAQSAVCAGAPVFTLTGGSPVGGTYSGTGVNSTTGEFNPATAGAGTHTITYSFTDGNSCSNSATQNITVHPQPTVTIGTLSAVCIDNGLVALSSGSPTPGTYSGTGVSGTNFNPQTAGVGTHTITYIHTDGNSCTDSASTNITVNALPNVSLAAIADVCVNASPVTLSGGLPAGGTYSGTGVNSTTGVFTPSTAGVGTHKITYTYSDANGCEDTASQNITVNAQPTVTLAAQGAVCAGAPVFTLTGGSPVGGTYSGSGVNSTTGEFNPATAGAGTHTITYSFTDGNSCSNSATQNITVHPQPTVTIGTFSPVCVGGAVTVALTSGSPTPGTYNGLGVSGSIFNPNIAGVGTHKIGYVHTDNNGCTDSASANITVNALPNVSLAAIADVCVNASPVTLSGGLPAGGTYSGTGVNSTTGVFTPSTAGVGTHKITYTYSDANGCEDTASQNITVNAQPTVTLAAQAAVCAGAPVFTLTGGSPVGGTYSGTGVNSTTGEFNPATAGAGTHTITYSFTDGNSCSNSATQSITVHPQPTVTIGTLSAVCIDNGLVALTSGSPTPGTYSGVGVSGTNFNPQTAGVGTHTITYIHTDGNSCTDSASTNITVNALPNVSLAAIADVCVNASPVTLSGGLPAGGTYSGTGVNSTTGVFTPSTAGVGTHKITYTYSDANGCEDTASQNITVNAQPTVTLAAQSAVCAGAPAFTLTGGSPVGGTYSGTGVNSTTGEFNPATAGAGTHTITYSFIDGNSCSNSATQNITVHPQPTVTIGALSAVCIDNGLVALSSGSPTPGTYSGVGVSGTNFNPQTAGVGTHTITYTHTDGNSCTDSASTNITVNALPNVTLAALADVCVNASPVTLSGGLPAGGTYSGTGVNSTTGVFTPSTAGVGTHKITYTYSDANGCEDTASQNITVNAQPTVTLAAQAAVCAGAPAFTLTGGSPVGGTYSGTGVNSTTGEFNPATAGAGTHKITYTYNDVNGCQDTASQNITVHPQPTVTLSSFSNLCFNAPNLILSGGAPSGGTYSGNGVSSGVFNPTSAGNGVHIIKYQFTDGNSCTDSALQSITVDTVTALNYPTLASICSGSAQTPINTATPVGGDYKGPGIVNDTLFDPVITGTGTFTLRYVFTNAFGCKDSTSQTIGVDTIPTVSFSVLDSICENSDSITLTGSPSGGVFTGNGVSGNKFGAQALNGYQTITYIFTGVNGCTNSAVDSIRVDSVTLTSFTLPDSICAGSSPLALNGAPLNGTYKLNGSSYTGSTYIPIVSNKIDSVTYIFTNAFGCVDSTLEAVRVDSITSVSLASFNPICMDDTITLTGGLPLGGVYSGVGVVGNLYSRDTNGLWPITYTFTNQFGCVDSVDSNILVKAKPRISINSNMVLCANTPDFELQIASPAGGKYFGTGIVNDSIFSASSSGVGAFSIDYVVRDTNACLDSTSFTLTVDTVPNVSLDTFSFVCTNALPFNLSGGAPNGGKYFGVGVDTAGKFDPSIGYGTYNIGYRLVDANGCQDSVINPIEVDTLIKVVSASMNDVCKNVGDLVLPTGIPSIGKFVGTGVKSGGIFNPIDNPVGVNSLYYTAENRCGTDSLKVSFNVDAVPQAQLASFGKICNVSEGLELTQGTPRGGTYFVDGVESRFLSAKVGKVNVEYVVSIPNGCSDTASRVVEYYKSPIVNVVGDKAVCAGDSARLRVQEDMAVYIWNGDTASKDYMYPAEKMILGQNKVKLMVVDAQGCSTETEVQIQSNICGVMVQTAPNPNNGQFTIVVNSPLEGEVDIAVWNSMGQRISGFNTVLIAGKNEFLYDLLGAAPGNYLLEIIMGQERVVEKFIIK